MSTCEWVLICREIRSYETGLDLIGIGDTIVRAGRAGVSAFVAVGWLSGQPDTEYLVEMRLEDTAGKVLANKTGRGRFGTRGTASISWDLSGSIFGIGIYLIRVVVDGVQCGTTRFLVKD